MTHLNTIQVCDIVDTACVKAGEAHRINRDSINFTKTVLSLGHRVKRRGAHSINAKSLADKVYDILFSANKDIHIDDIVKELVASKYVTTNKLGMYSAVSQELYRGKKEGWAYQGDKPGMWYNV